MLETDKSTIWQINLFNNILRFFFLVFIWRYNCSLVICWCGAEVVPATSCQLAHNSVCGFIYLHCHEIMPPTLPCQCSNGYNADHRQISTVLVFGYSREIRMLSKTCAPPKIWTVWKYSILEYPLNVVCLHKHYKVHVNVNMPLCLETKKQRKTTTTTNETKQATEMEMD